MMLPPEAMRLAGFRIDDDLLPIFEQPRISAAEDAPVDCPSTVRLIDHPWEIVYDEARRRRIRPHRAKAREERTGATTVLEALETRGPCEMKGDTDT